jgi:hypothetical protein
LLTLSIFVNVSQPMDDPLASLAPEEPPTYNTHVDGADPSAGMWDDPANSSGWQGDAEAANNATFDPAYSGGDGYGNLDAAYDGGQASAAVDGEEPAANGEKRLSWHQLIAEAEADKNTRRIGSAASALTMGTVGRDLWAKFDAITGGESPSMGLGAQPIQETGNEEVDVNPKIDPPASKKKGGKAAGKAAAGAAGKKKKTTFAATGPKAALASKKPSGAAASSPPSKIRKPQVRVPTQARLKEEELANLPPESPMRESHAAEGGDEDGEPDLSALVDGAKPADPKQKAKARGVSLLKELADLKRKYRQEAMERARLEKVLREIQAGGAVPLPENSDPNAPPGATSPVGTGGAGLPLLAMAALNSTSLDQAENMRNHYEKRIDLERRKLTRALEDNKILSMRLKETDINGMKSTLFGERFF